MESSQQHPLRSRLHLLLPVLILIWLCVCSWSAEAQAQAQRHHINSFGHSRSGSSSGCRKPSLELIQLKSVVNVNHNSSSSFQKIAICKSSKPIKPSRVLDMSKAQCAAGWTICNHLEPGVVGLGHDQHKWTPSGCFGFKYGGWKKAGGYGSRCRVNLYYDGVLCCPTGTTGTGAGGRHHRKPVYKKSSNRHYLTTNEIH